MKQFLAFLIAAPFVIFAGLVTAAVTDNRPASFDQRFHYTQVGEYSIYLKNNKTGNAYEWKTEVYPTKAICETAYGNANEVLKSVSDPDPEVKVKDWENIVPRLADALDAVMIRMYMSTGILPDLSVFCDLKRGPGRPA